MNFRRGKRDVPAIAPDDIRATGIRNRIPHRQLRRRTHDDPDVVPLNKLGNVPVLVDRKRVAARAGGLDFEGDFPVRFPERDLPSPLFKPEGVGGGGLCRRGRRRRGWRNRSSRHG